MIYTARYNPKNIPTIVAVVINSISNIRVIIKIKNVT